MAAESVGVTLEFASAQLSHEDRRDLESGYLTLDVLKSSLAMKAKQARVGENRERRGKGTFNGYDGFCDNLMKNPSIDSVSS